MTVQPEWEELTSAPNSRRPNLMRFKPSPAANSIWPIPNPALPLSRFFEHLTTAVDDFNRWKKWLQPAEQGLALRDSSPARQEWMLKTGARYVWTAPDVVAARAQLYENLGPLLGDRGSVTWRTGSPRTIHLAATW